ncbi:MULTISPECIES: class I SAM-dependent methyltransferase [Bradyrhizobium]|jgi:ubiquinone/menaquinone biosynthesis C-methylase UbiE|uniref:class I SAM-dependent methyltransferase n=1 Tax=Bradyrhizobium TaxID=374 RepID=UPI0004208DFE|nr:MULTISPECIES: class I SAM-dependent methyltransferase [Bradyrhizobium]MBO4221537.1 methyltransferase domain-containing protein [Bradyrhizobium neotropicale]RZN33375.1 class I SAM-dependent methyltransferase [Bradyrhizobium sp. Leo121]
MSDRSSLDVSAEKIGHAWKESAYYDDAERWTKTIFWNPETIFSKLFSRLDLTTVIELACGRGRHAEQIASQCGSLLVVDIHEENIEFCKSRLAHHRNVSYLKNNGYEFSGVPNNSMTAIYCYDAMVHFSPDLVENYLKETARVLAPGGMALYHHSNYDAPNTTSYGANPHARNHMTFDLFSEYARNAGLLIEESHPIKWARLDDLDRVTLLRLRALSSEVDTGSREASEQKSRASALIQSEPNML